MTLSEYLTLKNMKPSVFATEIGVPPSTITRIIRGERMPQLPLIALIHDKTKGKVTADDFLPMSARKKAATAKQNEAAA